MNGHQSAPVERSRDDLLTVPAIHAQYGLPIRTVRYLIYDQRGDTLPLVRLGRRVFVRRGDLLDYLAAHTATSNSEADDR